MSKYSKIIKKAASYVKESDALIVMTGSGMSVDSGCKTFRGEKGIYDDLPKRKNGEIMDQFDVMDHQFFVNDVASFWYFYGQRYMEY